MRGPALVVDDPTLDLPIGRAEADAATRRLSEYGLDVVRVSGPDATLPRVTQAAAPASLVHMAAHDRADPFQPERCGLVLSTGPLPPGIAELLAEPPAPLAADPPTVVERRAGEI
ncbi:hypothetical protein [Microbispora sp. H10830]|uniref:hypothetical protein n=1 Tax=Microbispora sp. H10830 TaxID=2729109 RepID=UPI0037C5575A